MNPLAIDVIFRRIVTEETQIEKIGRARQEFEGCEISFVERAGVGPDPANAMLFQKANNLRPMPSGVAKLDSETKIAW